VLEPAAPGSGAAAGSGADFTLLLPAEAPTEG